MPSPPTALVIVGRPPVNPIAALAVGAAVDGLVLGVSDGLDAVIADGELAVTSGAADALTVEGALPDCTKLNPPTAITVALPNRAKP